MKRTIDVKDLLYAIRKRWVTVLGLTLLFTLIGGFVGYFIPPAYEAKIDLLVNSLKKTDGNTVSTTGEIETNLRLIETYTSIFKSNRLVSKVSGSLGGSYTKTKVADKVKIETGSGSQIISIIVRERTAERAAVLANKYAITFQEEIRTLMNLDNITILKEVIVGTDTKAIKPFIFYYLIIALCIGLILGIVLVIIEEVYFPRLTTSQKAEKSLGIPLLGSISMKKEKYKPTHSSKALASVDLTAEFPWAIGEDFNKLAANIHHLIKQKKVKTIMMISTVSGEGKTFIGRNLAVKLAMDGKKTLFLDADLRKSDGRILFNLPNRKGLTSVISGFYNVENVIQETKIENLSFIGTGPQAIHPVKFLLEDRMDKLLDDVKTMFDVVIIDSTALNIADGINLITAVDGCIFVAHSRKTKLDKALSVLYYLKKFNANIVGAVLNGHKKGVN